MFIVFKNFKSVFCYLLIFTVLFGANAFFSFNNQIVTASPIDKFCVVLDAGHGGIDGGCQGSTGVYERDINLNICNYVADLLNQININVVKTRETQDGLYGVFASGFKMRDLTERKRIIEQSNADLVVSIHLNSFPNPKARGAQVYYALNSDISVKLATLMQDLFVKNLSNARKSCLPGDFYILNCTDKPGVLIECGFLSNVEEEALLVTQDYQQKIAYQIYCAIFSYFGLSSN